MAWKMVQHIPVDLRRIEIEAALKLATQYKIYAYDAYFLECAISLHSPLLTLDRQMKVIAQKIGIKLWSKDYESLYIFRSKGTVCRGS